MRPFEANKFDAAQKQTGGNKHHLNPVSPAAPLKPKLAHRNHRQLGCT
jgi:hypothetical protein